MEDIFQYIKMNKISKKEIIKLTELNNKLKNDLIEEKNKNKILEKSIENYKKEISELKHSRHAQEIQAK